MNDMQQPIADAPTTPDSRGSAPVPGSAVEERARAVKQLVQFIWHHGKEKELLITDLIDLAANLLLNAAIAAEISADQVINEVATRVKKHRRQNVEVRHTDKKL